MISPPSSDLPKLAPSPLSAAEQYDGRQISLSVHPLLEGRWEEKKAVSKDSDFTVIYSFYCAVCSLMHVTNFVEDPEKSLL